MNRAPSLSTQLRHLPSAFLEGLTRRKRTWYRRFHDTAFGLLYPAVLGTVFVELAGGVRAGLTGVKWAFVLLILGHFLIDYLITSKIPGYGSRKFIIDTAVVLLLGIAFYAINSSESTEPVNVPWIAGSVAGIYLLFICWEYLSPPLRAIRSVLVLYEAVFAVTSGAIAIGSIAMADRRVAFENALIVALAFSATCFWIIAVAKEPLVSHFDPKWDVEDE